MPNHLGELPVIDAHELPPELRALLRPGETMRDREGVEHVLPRWFYEVTSWECALETAVAPHFMLWEFMTIDVREAERFRQRFPRYVPCTIALLASALEVFRDAVGTYVHIAANGGYRPPAHGLARHASRHCWASPANLYRVGDDWLDSADTIRKYADVVRAVLPAAWIRPYGPDEGMADDHLHLDLGYVAARPTSGKTASQEDAEAAA